MLEVILLLAFSPRDLQSASGKNSELWAVLFCADIFQFILFGRSKPCATAKHVHMLPICVSAITFIYSHRNPAKQHGKQNTVLVLRRKVRQRLYSHLFKEEAIYGSSLLVTFLILLIFLFSIFQYYFGKRTKHEKDEWAYM